MGCRAIQRWKQELAVELRLVAHSAFLMASLNPFGWNLFDAKAAVVDGYTGATPLSLAFQGGWENVTATLFSKRKCWWGDDSRVYR